MSLLARFFSGISSLIILTVLILLIIEFVDPNVLKLTETKNKLFGITPTPTPTPTPTVPDSTSVPEPADQLQPEVLPSSYLIGDSIRCINSGEDPNYIYRYTDTKKIRQYPTPDIANSWNPNWDSIKDADCSKLEKGSPLMSLVKDLQVGDSVSCTNAGENPGNIYRYGGDNKINLYPNEDIANSWNTNWGSNIKSYDCSKLEKGPALSAKV